MSLLPPFVWLHITLGIVGVLIMIYTFTQRVLKENLCVSEVLAATITGVILGPALCAVLDPTALSSNDDVWFQIFQQVSSQSSAHKFVDMLLASIRSRLLPGMSMYLRILDETRQDMAACSDLAMPSDGYRVHIRFTALHPVHSLVQPPVSRADHASRARRAAGFGCIGPPRPVRGEAMEVSGNAARPLSPLLLGRLLRPRPLDLPRLLRPAMPHHRRVFDAHRSRVGVLRPPGEIRDGVSWTLSITRSPSGLTHV